MNIQCVACTEGPDYLGSCWLFEKKEHPECVGISGLRVSNLHALVDDTKTSEVTITTLIESCIEYTKSKSKTKIVIPIQRYSVVETFAKVFEKMGFKEYTIEPNITEGMFYWSYVDIHRYYSLDL